MIRSRRRRAAARSLVLLRLVQACTSCGRVEMISVWLLVLKLLRATAGVKRPNGNELTEGRRDSLDAQQKEQENFPEAISMETSQLSEMADVQADLVGQKDEESHRRSDDKERLDGNSSECLDTEKANSPLVTGQESDNKANQREGTKESDGSANLQANVTITAEDSNESVLNSEPEESRLVEEEENGAAKDPDHKGADEAPKIEPESVLEQQIKELAVSDASTESCHENDRDDLSDCVHVEMAIVSSDSDPEEQWKTMFSPVVDEDEFGCIIEPGTLDANETTNRNHTTGEEMNSQSAIKAEPDEDEDPSVLTEGVDTPGQPDRSIECDLEDLSYKDAMHYSSLSKISENDVDVKNSLQRLSASTSELDKKLPQDYCVIQEMQSENVSTEHVDFRTARKQWQKMEEQCKALEQASTAKQSMVYTQRPKKDPDSDNLSLGDYQYTQFSPCSDDSGLDDTSYRSHYDEPETPVEREIRETMEREECFRRERALARLSPSEPVQHKPRPETLTMPKSEPEEKKKTYNTREDRCRSQRPSGATPPSFSVNASPSTKPTYHEMVANNVIILEPDSHPINQKQRGKNLLSPVTNKFHEWPSDSSNVIILETSNLIIRSASEFCLSSACQETQESTFHNNPFFKLRSHSTLSLVDQEIREVKQRDEEFRRQRAQLYAKEYDTILVSPSSLQNFIYDKPGGLPAKCKSSPSSPLKARKMDRSTLSCDQKFPEAPYTRVRRKSALVQRWEAAMLANQQNTV